MDKIERKIYEVEVKEFSEADLTVTHWISSERRDYGGDILYASKNDRGKGVTMDGHPPVLLLHGFQPSVGMEPVAKSLWVKPSEFKGKKGLEAKTQFFPDEVGKRLWKKNTDGYMTAWSVGWKPTIWEYKTEKNGEQTRHVYEWNLIEYSLCHKGMQPDAVTPQKGEEFISFKFVPELEAKRGELIAWKNDDGTWEEKPYPNFHACRLEDPDKYIRIRYEKDKFGKGIDAIWGVQGGNKPVELQAIRFDKTKFTVAEARKWIKDHEYKCKMFEPASEKCEKCGKPMLIKWEQDVAGDKCELTCEASFSYVHDGDCEKAEKYECECIKCGYKMETDEHCRDIKCSKCGGEMRRAERPGPGKEERRIEIKRWNKSLPECFDLDIGDRPPAMWEYDLYRKFLKCEVKNIFLNDYQIPSPLLGSYLGAIKEISKKYKLFDTRNFSLDGHEYPPRRQVIKLNSKSSDDFLISGIQFFDHGGIPLVLKFEPAWSGLSLSIITNQDQSEFNKGLLEELHLWVKQNNFLRGEKFALSGEFLDKTEDNWDGLILEGESKTIIQNAVNQINKKRGEMKSRGLLFVGNPGTGKTKAGRTIMNDCDSTFIWVSSKDFQYGSPVSMISLAFSLAMDLNPSVIFMEDIDTWIGNNYLVDLLKTEMDGLRQNKGVITILTSNNPERLPDALLDRPGRFHHVLDFKLPNTDHRLSMIKLWSKKEIDEGIISEIVEKTDGFSGAHLKELIEFAKIISEENGLSMGEAIQESLKRLMKQKGLIDAIRQNQKAYILPEIKLFDPELETDFCACDGEAINSSKFAPSSTQVIEEMGEKIKLCETSFKEMTEKVKSLTEQFKDINSRLDALSVKPGTEKEIDGKIENPPEPRKVVIVNSEEDKKKAAEDIVKQLSFQIADTIKKVVPQIVKEQIDKARGRVN
jgi:SpoVK/Ycf46/Vps4 family AAA+-type ATPase